MYRDNGPPQTPHLLITAFKGKVFAIDRTNGGRQWNVELEGWTSSVIDLAITSEAVIAVSNSRLAVLDYGTGEILAMVDRSAHERGVGARSVLLVDGEHLFVAADGSVACYTLRGHFVWEQHFLGEGTGETAIGFPYNVRQADARR